MAFIEELGNNQEDCGEVHGDIDDEDSADQEEPLPKLKTYEEVITAGGFVSIFGI